MKDVIAQIAHISLLVALCATPAAGQSEVPTDPVLQELSEELDRTIESANADLALVSRWLRDTSRIWFDSATSLGGHSGLEGAATSMAEESDTLDPEGENTDVLRLAAFVMNEERANRARQMELFATLMDMGQQLSGQSDLEWRWRMDMPTGDHLRQLQGRAGAERMRSISSALGDVTEKASVVANLHEHLATLHSSVEDSEEGLREATKEQEQMRSRIEAVCCVACSRMYNFADTGRWKPGLYDSDSKSFLQWGNEELRYNNQLCFMVESFDPIVLDHREISSADETRSDLAKLEVADAGNDVWDQISASELATVKRAAMFAAVRGARRNSREMRRAHAAYDHARDLVTVFTALSAHISEEHVVRTGAASEAVPRIWQSWAVVQDTAARMDARAKALKALAR